MMHNPRAASLDVHRSRATERFIIAIIASACVSHGKQNIRHLYVRENHSLSYKLIDSCTVCIIRIRVWKNFFLRIIFIRGGRDMVITNITGIYNIDGLTHGISPSFHNHIFFFFFNEQSRYLQFYLLGVLSTYINFDKKKFFTFFASLNFYIIHTCRMFWSNR